MKKLQKTLTSLILAISSATALFGCVGETFSKSVTFHIGENSFVAKAENSHFKADGVEWAHHRFMGWSTDTSKENIISDSQIIKVEDVAELFGEEDNLDLYAVYATVLTVRFVLDTTTTFSLDSDYENKETVPAHTKESFIFQGWSLTENGTSVALRDFKEVSYSLVAPILNGEYEASFYPVYVPEGNNIQLYQYDTSAEMAEIHITTENLLPIDDPSLIIPGEKKGKNGEIDVYDYVKATISVDHCEDKYELSNVAGKVKVRGNYTSTYDKKPIRIKFDSKQGMLGLNKNAKFKSWVLLANWKDTSLLRDACAFYLGNALTESDGFYCSDFRFVKVYLNNSYNGVYLLVEQQQIASKRVNIPESKSETDSEKTGYFLEFDGYYMNEPDIQKFTVSYNDVKTGNNGFTISNDVMNTAQRDFCKKAVQNIWKVVYDAMKKSHTNLTTNPYHTVDENGNYVVDTSITSAYEAVSLVVDINSLVDMYILHEILEDRDIGFSSFYFSLDYSPTGNKKLTFTAPWDFDYASGNNTFENAMKANLNTTKLANDGRLTSNRKKLTNSANLTKADFTFTNKDALYCPKTDNPWFLVFSGEQWLWNTIYKRWQYATDAGLFSSLLTMIDTYTTQYEQDFNENFTKWSGSLGITLSGYQPDLVKMFVNQKQAAQYLRIWLEARIEGLGSALRNKASTAK